MVDCGRWTASHTRQGFLSRKVPGTPESSTMVRRACLLLAALSAAPSAAFTVGLFPSSAVRTPTSMAVHRGVHVDTGPQDLLQQAFIGLVVASTLVLGEPQTATAQTYGTKLCNSCYERNHYAVWSLGHAKGHQRAAKEIAYTPFWDHEIDSLVCCLARSQIAVRMEMSVFVSHGILTNVFRFLSLFVVCVCVCMNSTIVP